MNIILSYAAYRFTDRLDGVGGEERVAWDIASALASRGHTVYVYSPRIELSRSYPGIIPEYIPRCDYKNQRGRLRKTVRLLRFARQSRRRIRERIQSTTVNVIHHLCPAYPGFASSVSDLFDPFVYGPATVRYDRSVEADESGSLLARAYERLKTAAYTRTLRNASVVLLEVPSAKRWIPRDVWPKTTVFSNAVQTAEYSPRSTPGVTASNSESLELIYHGGIRANKGIAFLIEALAVLHDRGIHPPALTLIGTVLDDSLRDLVRARDLERLVKFAGPIGRAEVPLALDRNAIYVFPTLQDNCPKGLLEAMAMGLPIVTTDVLDIPSVVRDEREGLIVPARDSGALAAAIHRLVDDRALREKLGRSARARCLAEFDLDRRMESLEEVYLQVDHHGE